MADPPGSLAERDPSLEEAPERPPTDRPALVELAAAFLIVGGILGIVGALGASGRLPEGTGTLLLVSIVLDIGAVAVGLLIRFGRLWILDVNYVAVLGFLDLAAAGGSGMALVAGVIDVVVVVILFVHKPWFDLLRAERAAAAEEARRTGRR
jgi:hypothetical protein